MNRRIKIDGRSGGFREQAIAKDYATSTLIVSFYENKQKAKEILREIRERYDIGAGFYVMPKE